MKKTAYALLMLGLICWFSYIGLIQYYDATRPRNPNIGIGRVIPQNTHGSVVYLTDAERTRLHYLGYGAVGFILAGAIVFTRRRLGSQQ